jgi:Zn-dependent M28 family amino/carboxypeptidase
MRLSRARTHTSSAFEFNLFWYFGPASPAVMAVVLTLMLLMPLATALHFVSGERVKRIRSRLYNVLVIGSVVVFACAFWHTGRVVPGAGDDLSGIAVMHAFAGEVAAAVSAEGSAQAAKYAYLGPLLDTTEMVVLATSGEEAGLRGAKRYCAKHAAELAALPTGVLVLESTHDVEHISVIASEPWPGAYHDAGMVDLAVAAGVAAELPFPVRVVSLPLGGTDGVAFTRAGAAVAVLNAVDVSKLPPQYHTRLDTLDTVAPEALEAQLKVVLHTAAAFGRGEWRRASKQGLLQWVVTMLRSVTGSSNATAAEL